MPSFSASSFHSSPPEAKLIASNELECSNITLQYKRLTQDPPNRQNSSFSLTITNILTFLKSIYSSQYFTILTPLIFPYTSYQLRTLYAPNPPPPTPNPLWKIAFQGATILLSTRPCATVPNIMKKAGNQHKADSYAILLTAEIDCQCLSLLKRDTPNIKVFSQQRAWCMQQKHAFYH